MFRESEKNNDKLSKKLCTVSSEHDKLREEYERQTNLHMTNEQNLHDSHQQALHDCKKQVNERDSANRDLQGEMQDLKKSLASSRSGEDHISDGGIRDQMSKLGYKIQDWVISSFKSGKLGKAG